MKTATSPALRTAPSSWQAATVALLDHDDALAGFHALYFVAQAINEHPDAQIIYSDGGQIDGQGRRFEPHFKSDWNPDLFFSQNYVSHLGVYRRALLQKIGGFRTGVRRQPGSGPVAALPASCRSGTDRPCAPRALSLAYRRRFHGPGRRRKSYTTEAGIKALRDYFDAFHPTPVQVEGPAWSRTPTGSAGRCPARRHWPAC